jgi:hypothetical protein
MVWFLVFCLGRTFTHPGARLRFYRKLASLYPDTFERAWQHENVLHPRVDDLIAFETCAHCLLPWPVQDDGRFGEHPLFDERVSREQCPGSSTRDYLVLD